MNPDKKHYSDRFQPRNNPNPLEIRCDESNFNEFLGSSQLNATSGASGTYIYTPPAGTVLQAGSQPLNVVFTPNSGASADVPSTRINRKTNGQLRNDAVTPSDTSTSYLAASATVNLTVNPATPTLALSCPEVAFDGKSHTCTGTATGLNGSSVSGTWSFSPVGDTSAGSYSIIGTFTSSDSNYTNGSASATLKIDQAASGITWPTPSGITYGTPLGATQLNASTTIPGTFAYSPVAGTILAAGTHTLSVTFTPADATDYTPTTGNVSIVVAQATPQITWATPAAISYGTALSASQLNATASIPGTFTYSPAIGSIPAVGNDTLTVAFTPIDTTDYTVATATVILVVTSPPNLAPSISALSPAFASRGGAAFALTVNGSGFTTNSTVYWGSSALATQYMSSTQIEAQVPEANIGAAGVAAITVQTPAPGGGTSNSFQFEVDSASSGTTPPKFATVTATVSPGSTASYPVTVPSAASNVAVTCLNLPSGATCAYSASTGAVTITTSATTPSGTYQITVVFTETVPGTSTALVLLPVLLLPLLFIRRKLSTRGIWITSCLTLVLLGGVAIVTGCGGGSSSSSTSTSPTEQVTSSGTVGLTVQ